MGGGQCTLQQAVFPGPAQTAQLKVVTAWKKQRRVLTAMLRSHKGVLSHPRAELVWSQAPGWEGHMLSPKSRFSECTPPSAMPQVAINTPSHPTTQQY